MTPEHLPTEQYEAQLAEKVVRLQTMMAPFAAPVPEVFRSPVSHYRMRAEFRLWHDGDDLYHIIFDQQTRSRIRVDSFPAASALINQLMTAMLEGVRNNPVLRHKLFQIDYLTTLSNQAVVSLLYHKKLDDAWREQAEALRDALRAQGLNVHLIGRATKTKIELNGHSDVVAGLAVVGDNAALAEKLGYLQNAVGGVLDPFSSFLTLRGIRTLALRMERHSANALQLAEWLEQQPEVERVWFPWLASHPHHQLARRQMALPGGMISVVVKGDDGYAERIISKLRWFTLAESLGGVESLVSQPFSMTHASIPLEKRLANGITPQLIRLSVGIEDPHDLIADWQQALREE